MEVTSEREHVCIMLRMRRAFEAHLVREAQCESVRIARMLLRMCTVVATNFSWQLARLTNKTRAFLGIPKFGPPRRRIAPYSAASPLRRQRC